MERKRKNPTKQHAKEFDPSEYDFLDNAHMNIWIKEFLLRNKEFMQEWNDIPKYGDMKIFSDELVRLINKYGVGLAVKYDEEGNEETFIVLAPSSVSVFRLMDYKTKKKLITETMSKDFLPRNRPSQRYLVTDDIESDPSEFFQYLFGYESQKSSDSYLNRLFLRIDLEQTQEVLLETFTELIKVHKKYIKQRRRRLDKWKYYLIVWDLRAANYSYNEILDIFIEHFPAFELVDEDKPQNLKNYRRAAQKLIDGGWRTYI